MRPTKKQRIIANAFQRHLNQWHGADYPVCKDYICRFAWRLECQDRVNNCQHDTVTDLGDGLYGCLDCGWFDDAGTPGKRAVIVQGNTCRFCGGQASLCHCDHPGEKYKPLYKPFKIDMTLEADYPGESWQVE